MRIFYQLDDFLYQIFPDLRGVSSDEALVKAIQNKYSTKGYTPLVKLVDGLIQIDLDLEQAKEVQSTYDQIVKSAEKGQFNKAKELIKSLIDQGSRNSEVYRIYGQILSEEGGYEEGIDQLIESLKWNPQNTNALLMMGNIYASAKNDLETAEVFYGKVMEHEYENYIALNNIAGIIAKSGNLEKALQYFEKAHEINPKYPNTLYGLALTHYNQGDYLDAFEKASSALIIINEEKINDRNLAQSCQSLQLESAKSYVAQIEEDTLFQPFLKGLEKKTSKKIDVIIDDSIPTAAKIEIAEYRGNPNHTIRYKRTNAGYSHLVFHELTHLELIDEARKEDENYLFTATLQNENAFYRKAEKDKKKMIKGGLPEQNFKPFLKRMFDGINLQMYNAPIDLFIEQRLYDRHKTLRPIQFLSLLGLHQQAVQGANDPTAKKIAPSFVRDANIILSYTQLFQLQELFGTNLVDQIKEPLLFNKAKMIYEEYLKMKDDKEGGEEYDLINWWAEDLKLAPFFTLEKEKNPKKKISSSSSSPKLKLPEDVLAEIENDPYGLNTDSLFEDEQMKKFVESNRTSETNMAVVMHMIDAIKYFSDKSKEKAKEAGMEIAELGRLGIDPNKKQTYSLSSIPNKKFSGWKMLAYMYATWSIFEPSVVPQLQLDFEEEYKLAKALAK